ncbi:hypothetical protein TNCV_2537411 [Trichonephila clavipes]|nr:hypothetical protein TNCV_2537411 [Trichonephila clavipes]
MFNAYAAVKYAKQKAKESTFLRPPKNDQEETISSSDGSRLKVVSLESIYDRTALFRVTSSLKEDDVDIPPQSKETKEHLSKMKKADKATRGILLNSQHVFGASPSDDTSTKYRHFPPNKYVCFFLPASSRIKQSTAPRSTRILFRFFSLLRPSSVDKTVRLKDRLLLCIKTENTLLDLIGKCAITIRNI